LLKLRTAEEKRRYREALASPGLSPRAWRSGDISIAKNQPAVRGGFTQFRAEAEPIRA
jgi:hypothetical protein